ncbi:DNA repair protein RecN [Psychrosphaera sp. F3M07]|uniref:DNA repair protein RecN n=1 Tax=Psychrosphaera sp. F3M07 TaxID=2841560 RepID=UPI001C0991E8|nr:DNA repair protein RecN [Psychrosphaera sp. F3M07]MBU2917592.1 DNA repair protein RecN [Psychrosphaera sp. F3M07]
MLLSLAIKNFAIVSQLEVNWHNQMTTITGETGAGKSIAIDALAQALGERSEASMVRANTDKAEVIAVFDITNLTSAQNWLKEHELFNDDECILRRVISKEGRSKAYINGSQVPASQLKGIGSLLVSIHGQHAHQLLTKPEHQRFMLDQYAGNQTLLNKLKANYLDLQSKTSEFKQLTEKQAEFSAQKQLLQYQVDELNNAELIEGEYQEIEQEHKRLHHANSLQGDSQHALDILHENENGNAYSALQSALSLLHKSSNLDSRLTPTIELLDSALIQLDEGTSELRNYIDDLELNPARLIEVEQRLNLYVELSRKHQVFPEQLIEKLEELTDELNKLTNSDNRLIELESEIEIAKNSYKELAIELTNCRLKFAKQLNQKITASMQQLNMGDAVFEIEIKSDPETFTQFGSDKIEFLVSANPGQPLQPLLKVASGGELSRMSLAIQVIIAQKVTTPTLLFDEVDVGVSGPTASAVGKLMRELSNNTQVICVTHLPQVACYGHQQQFVNKQTHSGMTQTSMEALNQTGRIDELARLLGGDTISATTKANALELLSIAHAH